MTDAMNVTERPDLYDWLYDDFTDDINMYLSFAATHSQVLECGIGTGRIAIPLAEKGIAIYGIDNSDHMLKRLEDNIGKYPGTLKDRVKSSKADMRNFDLGILFSLIYIPFSSFNYLLSVEDQKSCLASIRRHIYQDGILVLELLSFSLYPNWLDNQPIMRKVKERVDLHTGKKTELWKTSNFDSATQIVSEQRHYRLFDNAGKLEREEVVLWKNRFFFRGEIQLLLELAGFEITNVYGDYCFGPYEHTSEFMVVVARPVQ